MKFLTLAALAAVAVSVGVIGVRTASSTTPAAGNISGSAGEQFVARLTASVGGGVWKAGRFQGQAGEACRELRAPGGWIVSHCSLPSQEFARGPLNISLGGTPQVAYLYGIARNDVVRVELTMDNCSVRAVPLADSLFLAVFAKPEQAAKPYKLTPIGASGSPMQSVELGGMHAGSTTDC